MVTKKDRKNIRSDDGTDVLFVDGENVSWFSP